ncbi:hypothetical protein ACFE04_019600 [Oxalis oulophora]
MIQRPRSGMLCSTYLDRSFFDEAEIPVSELLIVLRGGKMESVSKEGRTRAESRFERRTAAQFETKSGKSFRAGSAPDKRMSFTSPLWAQSLACSKGITSIDHYTLNILSRYALALRRTFPSEYGYETTVREVSSRTSDSSTRREVNPFWNERQHCPRTVKEKWNLTSYGHHMIPIVYGDLSQLPLGGASVPTGLGTVRLASAIVALVKQLISKEISPSLGNLMLPAGTSGPSSSTSCPRWNVDLNAPPRDEAEVPVQEPEEGYRGEDPDQIRAAPD